MGGPLASGLRYLKRLKTKLCSYLSKRLRRHLARALRFFMILISNAGLSCRLRACGASFGEARLQFSQFCMRDTLSCIFDSLITPF